MIESGVHTPNIQLLAPGYIEHTIAALLEGVCPICYGRLTYMSELQDMITDNGPPVTSCQVCGGFWRTDGCCVEWSLNDTSVVQLTWTTHDDPQTGHQVEPGKKEDHDTDTPAEEDHRED